MTISEFKRAVLQFDAPERVYVSVLLPPFQGLRSTLTEKKATKSRNGSIVWSTPWFVDQVAYLMKLENPVQTFLGLKEATEDVFFKVQYNTTIKDQHFQSISWNSSLAASSTSSRARSCFTDLRTR